MICILTNKHKDLKMKYIDLEQYNSLPRTREEFFVKGKNRFMGYMNALIERNKDSDVNELISENAQVIASEYYSNLMCRNSIPVFVGEDQANHYGLVKGYYYAYTSSGFETFNEKDKLSFVEMINKEIANNDN